MANRNDFSYLNIDVPAGFVHIYTRAILPDTFAGLPFQLSDHEMGRAGAYSNLADRERYIQAHVFLRQVLSKYINIPPADIIFRYTALGQPLLAIDAQLYFSLSYRGAQVIAGVSHNPIGVDVEKMREIDDIDHFAQNFFSAAECAHIRSIDNPAEKINCFFSIWTLKEAFIKGTGLGISYGLQRFSTLPGTSKNNPVLHCDEKHWMLKQVDMPEGYAAAVAMYIGK